MPHQYRCWPLLSTSLYGLYQRSWNFEVLHEKLDNRNKVGILYNFVRCLTLDKKMSHYSDINSYINHNHRVTLLLGKRECEQFIAMRDIDPATQRTPLRQKSRICHPTSHCAGKFLTTLGTWSQDPAQVPAQATLGQHHYLANCVCIERRITSILYQSVGLP